MQEQHTQNQVQEFNAAKAKYEAELTTLRTEREKLHKQVQEQKEKLVQQQQQQQQQQHETEKENANNQGTAASQKLVETYRHYLLLSIEVHRPLLLRSWWRLCCVLILFCVSVFVW